jgi:hypothetical protein
MLRDHYRLPRPDLHFVASQQEKLVKGAST